ncbi:DUF1003 domain-containing protein [Janthinobacterium sp. B9-8]|uniref:DUF1003 domain-containing protein n=1 Tax=Janthinobacterium sp. B9-8 TaxID=1236179 RepID=UPI00061D08D9|nr:DUF1003 domain-containing protein [Janthinobacterium sp. B9-8]AMC33212.1 hypothetical protein VN23_00535 [Janthinobacterium sp. B9-8]
MGNSNEQLASQFLKTCKEAGESEQEVMERLKKRLNISHNTNQKLNDTLTLGQRLADKIALFGGSWTFILIFLAILFAWIILNTLILTNKSFDPYPYVFLNLILSMLAALQAPVIMMSQNRHAAKDRAAAEHDYEVNLKSELEVLALNKKIDILRDQQWSELVSMQQKQIKLLTQVLEKNKTSAPKGPNFLSGQ